MWKEIENRRQNTGYTSFVSSNIGTHKVCTRAEESKNDGLNICVDLFFSNHTHL